MEVYCNNISCLFCDGEKCTSESIHLDDDLQCIVYESIFNSKEYLNEYYIAVKMKSGKPGRAVRYGARLEYNGYTFFTEDNYKILGDESRITEERTGLNMSLGVVKHNFDFFDNEIRKKKSCSEFPLCVWNESERAFVIEDEVKNND